MDHLTRWDVFLGCLGAVAPLVAAFALAHWQNRKDKKKLDSRMELLLVEYPLHRHGEVNEFALPADSLTVKGVSFPKKANGSA